VITSESVRALRGVSASLERLAQRAPTRGRRWLPVATAATVIAAFAAVELRTGQLSSRLLAAFGRRLTAPLAAGASHLPLEAPRGPYDMRLGYAQLPDFTRRLSDDGFEVVAQAQPSAPLVTLAAVGVFPPYHAKTQAGLSLLDRRGEPMFVARRPVYAYRRLEDVPSIVVHTLLAIENRELLNPDHPFRNPAVEWDRLARAVADLAVHVVDPRHPVSGGSTLPTQLAKLRHSAGGRTSSPMDKGRQLLSASLEVYLDGPDTTNARRRIVRDYLNSLPLGAIAGWGEVTGLGDGLAAWFGTDVDVVNRLLTDVPASGGAGRLAEQAHAYREVLMLLLAIKKPSVYLSAGTDLLDRRVDGYLGTLAELGVISPALREATLRVRVKPRRQVPVPPVPFIERKAADAVRRQLLGQLGLSSTYDLDRLDLSVRTTLDGDAVAGVIRFLNGFRAPSSVAAAGLNGAHLLDRGDPAGLTYSFTLYERGPDAARLRVQADTFDGPLDISDGTRLELGSTAKLRTLVTYLEVVAALHGRYGGLTAERLRSTPLDPGDALSRWAVDYLRRATDRGLPAMLEAAMARRYSASPAEGFFTGGGLHYFENYEPDSNGRILTIREAFRESVNLVFIRLMRDVVHYFMFGPDGAGSAVLREPASPARRQYLERFADVEGQTFLRRFSDRYQGQTPAKAFETLIRAHHPSPKRLAVIYRSVYPEASLDEFVAFLRARPGAATPGRRDLERWFRTFDPARLTLNDRGYLAGVHPLELWLLAYRRDHPDATRSELVAASTDQRQQIYAWLFKTRHPAAQNIRIQTLLEQDAFARIHRDWQRLGYPFPSLVPSYATAIGSSGDTPAALADLVGVLANDGIRSPRIRVERLRFAEATPYETVVQFRPHDQARVLPREIAGAVRQELFGVVSTGTGRRLARGLDMGGGRTIPVGGKTGTGDNRFIIHTSAGPQLLVQGRTATFVFILGDRFFGTLTAYVSGKAATNYAFTSALPVELLRQMGPSLRPLLDGDGAAAGGRGVSAGSARQAG